MTPKDKADLLITNFRSRGMNKNRLAIKHNPALKDELLTICTISVQDTIDCLGELDKLTGYHTSWISEKIYFYENVKNEIEISLNN